MTLYVPLFDHIRPYIKHIWAISGIFVRGSLGQTLRPPPFCAPVRTSMCACINTHVPHRNISATGGGGGGVE